MSHSSISRRRFLAAAGGIAAGSLVAACSAGRASSVTRVTATSPQVAATERARRTAGQSTTDVNLDALQGDVDLGGRVVRTWTYGGQLPGREIRVRRGDMLRVSLRNGLPEATTIHWHGVALRNDMDGVPELTQPPIGARGSFRYEFTIPHAGTYFFHPHVGVQLDRGLYAPLIVEDPDAPADYDTELVVVLDDWLDGLGRDPDGVFKELRAGGMGSMGMARSTLLGGDVGDVTYPYFLVNGRLASAPQVVAARSGQRIRLRLINAGADTAFRVGLPGVPMTVTHTDGFPVQPANADAVLLGMGERIDAIITVPDRPLPLLALAEGKNGFAQLVLQPGRAATPDPAVLVGELSSRPVLMAGDTRAADAVRLARRAPDVVHELKVGGPDRNYTWTINGQVYDPNRGLPVREGQRVRLRFTNTTTMFHPMHLHGHTFQVRSPGGSGPRKDTINVLPGKALEVDFDADNPGQWLTHCHNAYHGEAGIMTVVSYVE
ncbi:MAG: multicopper oxidase family protein [Actinomycetota bacterium]|nr:multicopper oxidase family protein [Actinomycetota bacterium]